jgi:hypothetical protein
VAIDFSKILSKQAAAIEQPKPFPEGTYLVNNPKLPDFKGIGKNESAAAQFGFIILAPGDDVDMTELNKIENWKGRTKRHNMFLTEASEYRTKEELIRVFNLEEGDKTLGQLFNETVNKQCYIKIKHIPREDGTGMIDQIDELLPA